eukprot:XP_011678439.1 PREDICTED: uncharacterized protein LOC105445085 [Strongylocentrotus purpuratus]
MSRLATVEAPMQTHVDGYAWEKLPEKYRQSPYFTLDDAVDSFVSDTDAHEPCVGIEEVGEGDTPCIPLPTRKSKLRTAAVVCRKKLQLLTSFTFLCKDEEVLEELRQMAEESSYGRRNAALELQTTSGKETRPKQSVYKNIPKRRKKRMECEWCTRHVATEQKRQNPMRTDRPCVSYRLDVVKRHEKGIVHQKSARQEREVAVIVDGTNRPCVSYRLDAVKRHERGTIHQQLARHEREVAVIVDKGRDWHRLATSRLTEQEGFHCRTTSHVLDRQK